MAQLSYVEKDGGTEDQTRMLGQLTQKSGKIANMWKIWAHSPKTLEAYMPFYKSLSKGSLDPKLRELAYVKASMINNCAYCADAHKAMGARSGVTEQQLKEIDNYASSEAFSDVERLVLQYSEELTRSVKRNDALIGRLKEHLSEADLVELNLTIGMANLTNRFNVSFATDAD